MNKDEVLLRVDNLVKYFPRTSGGLFRRKTLTVKAVDGISFDVRRGETLGLVGESGCGKSTAGRAILQLYRPTSGHVYFEGMDLVAFKNEELRKMRRKMQMIFQDPYASLNPRWRVADIVAEPLRTFGLAKDRADVDARVDELLRQVRLAPADKEKYPHQFSGGQRQRVAIARALVTEPSIILADEPTGNLDSAGANAIFQLFQQLITGGKTIMMVTHDNELARRATRTLLVKDGAIANEYAAPPAMSLDEERVAQREYAFSNLTFAPGTTVVQ